MKKNWNSKPTIGNDPLKTFLPMISRSLFIFWIVVTLAACQSKDTGHSGDTYTCPMHPTVISDKPGTCPVCGMDLVRKARPGEGVELNGELARLIKSPNEIVVASIKTIKGEYKTMPVVAEVPGMVTYDTRYVYTAPVRISGRLEQVYIKYVFQPVAKGQKIAEIYSPEMITAQRELLYLVEHDPDEQNLIEAARNKLQLLGATHNQIEDVIRSKNVIQTFSIFSLHDGFVMPGGTATPTLTNQAPGASMMGGAQPAPSAAPPAAEISGLPRIGNYVSAGQTLFQVVNANAVRIELNLPLSLAAQLKVNDLVSLNWDGKNFEKATVDFVQPFLGENEEFIKVRLYINNTYNLKIGQLVKATVKLAEKEALWIPDQAVLDTGLKLVVFVKDGDSFAPRTIVTGMKANGWIEVTRGLASADEIASDAQYMIDSESFVKTK